MGGGVAGVLSLTFYFSPKKKLPARPGADVEYERNETLSAAPQPAVLGEVPNEPVTEPTNAAQAVLPEATAPAENGEWSR